MRPIDLAADETVAFVLAHIAQPPLRILDVGCGTGLVACRLQAHGYDVVAIDESAELVQQTRALGVDAQIAAWPSFVGTPFDVVLFARSLHHIQPLTAAVEHAYRLLVPSGLVLVDDFAWTEIDPVSAEWFYSIVRLLSTCQVLVEQEDSFATELVRSGGEFTFWQQSHDHELHTVTAMWSVLQHHFQSLSETSAPYLYRYVCPVVAENEAGHAIVSQVRDMEQRLAHLGTLTLIGRRFVGRKR
ncbi:MAG: class I SAM-dependent methyltransferase [Roseiflexaceae bacterium]